jgi:4a-hydroxytetrahydrobiopterin dehydratase
MIQWEEHPGQLVAELLFRDFSEAFSFIQIIAQLAEEVDHHPDLNWRYNKIQVGLSTHDLGGVVSEKDRLLASRIDSIYAAFT